MAMQENSPKQDIKYSRLSDRFLSHADTK